jgi:hypothetical protein
VHRILPYNREGERIANESSGAPSKRSSKRQETPISHGGLCIGEREGGRGATATTSALEEYTPSRRRMLTALAHTQSL